MKKQCIYFRRVALLLCLSLILSLVPADFFGNTLHVRAANSTPMSIVPNGDFESDSVRPLNWKPKTNNLGVAIVTAGVPGNDTYVLNMKNTGNSYLDVDSDFFSVVPGGVYRFSLKAMLDDSVVPTSGWDYHFVAFVMWEDPILILDGKGMNVKPTDRWSEFTMDVTIPDGVTKAAIRLCVVTNKQIAAFVDDVSLIKIGGPEAPETQPTEVPTEAPTEVPTEAPTEAPAEDLDLNWSFETLNKDGLPSVWSLRQGMSVNTTDKVDGNNSLQVDAVNVANFVRSYALPVNAGDTYELTISIKRVSGNAGIYAGIWFGKEGYVNYDNNCCKVANIKSDNKWHKYSVSWAAEGIYANAPYVWVEIGNNTGNASYLIDDIIFKINGKVVGAPDNADSGETEQTQPVVPNEPAYIFSDTFDNINQWTASHGNIMAWIPDPGHDAYEGNRVLLMQDYTTAQGHTITSDNIFVVPGETYTLSYQVMDHWDYSGSSIGSEVRLIFIDASGKVLETVTKPAASEEGANVTEWTAKTIEAVAPANAAILRVAFNTVVEKKDVIYLVDALTVYGVEGTDIGEVPEAPPALPTLPDYVQPAIPEGYEPPVVENFPGEHPYLYLNDAELEELKQRMNDTELNIYGFSWKMQKDNLLTYAQQYLVQTELRVGSNYGTYVVYPLYPHLADPNDPQYRQMYIEASKDANGNLVEIPYLGFGSLFPDPLQKIMETLSLAYALTGDTRYSDLAIRYAVEMCGWEYWTDWNWLSIYGGNKYIADSGFAQATMGISAVYDLCHDQLTQKQKEIIETAIIEKGIEPMLMQIDPYNDSSGDMFMLGGVLIGLSAIVTEENYEQLKTYFDVILPYLEIAFDDYAFSGETEGHYYTDLNMQYLMPGVYTMHRATRLESLFGHPWLSEMLPAWTVMFASPNSMVHPPYSDGHVGVYLEMTMAMINKNLGNGLAGYFVTQTGGLGTPWLNFVYLDPSPVVEEPADRVAVVNPIGYGALRTGFASDDMLLTMIANGSQMHHNHYDQNSIMLSAGGTWLLSDAGAGSYYDADRYFWTHGAHSTILVDGQTQSVKGNGNMEKIFGSSLYGYIIGSAPKAYGANTLDKFDRHAIQLNHTEKAYYIIIDDLVSENEHEFSWQMYNGGSGTAGLTVDGEILPELTTVTGNDVSLVVGVNKLNLSFVAKDGIDMTKKIYQQDGTYVGDTFLASSAATKAHQFMAVISAEEYMGRDYINIGAMVTDYYKDKAHTLENGISYSSTNNGGGNILRPNTIGTMATMFFRGGAPGDWVKVPFEVKEDGIYDLTTILGVSDGCCTTKVIIDGKYESDPYDLSGLPETTYNFKFEELELTAGTHYVTYEVVDKGYHEKYAGEGWYLINVGGVVLDKVTEEDKVADKVTVAQTYDDENVLGALINYAGNLCDLVMFNRTDKLVAAGKMSSDGQQASVLGIDNGKITEGFAATKATKLIYDGKTLFEAEKALNIVADAEGWHIDTAEVQTVKLNIGAGELISVLRNGERVEVTAEDGFITLELAAGYNDVAVDMIHAEPEVVAGDFNDDGELTDADAIYLLYATFDSEGYPLNQKADFNGDGEVTDSDAIYLLYATFDPDGYPIG